MPRINKTAAPLRPILGQITLCEILLRGNTAEDIKSHAQLESSVQKLISH